MQLKYDVIGDGFPLVVLHGLFGSRDNWRSIARRLAKNFSVYTLDLRNHGEAFHQAGMTYDELAGDVCNWLQHMQLSRIHLMGHSMGGKTAMQLAVSFPEIINRLIVADIAAKRYPPDHAVIIEALKAINLAEISTRRDADQQLAAHLSDPLVRAFLLKNLVAKDGGFVWRIDLTAIDVAYTDICAAPDTHRGFAGPTLFIRGARSSFVLDEDIVMIEKDFPDSRIETIADAGHWLHAEKPDDFCSLVSRFLLS